MVDDLILILASVGTATASAALLRRRARRATRESWAPFAGAGARHLADTLCPAATEPLPVAGHAWKSLAEILEPSACHGLGRAPAAPAERWTRADPVHRA